MTGLILIMILMEKEPLVYIFTKKNSFEYSHLRKPYCFLFYSTIALVETLNLTALGVDKANKVPDAVNIPSAAGKPVT